MTPKQIEDLEQAAYLNGYEAAPKGAMATGFIIGIVIGLVLALAIVAIT